MSARDNLGPSFGQSIGVGRSCSAERRAVLAALAPFVG